MNSNLIQSVFNHTPPTWQGQYYEARVNVSRSSREFDEIKELIHRYQRSYNQEIKYITRVENVILYGQFICREQYLTTKHSSYYVVRKFVIIRKSQLDTALKYNLDSRRLGIHLTFTSRLNFYIDDDTVLLVILVLTHNPNNDFIPTFSNDYYIEYVITFD